MSESISSTTLLARLRTTSAPPTSTGPTALSLTSVDTSTSPAGGGGGDCGSAAAAVAAAAAPGSGELAAGVEAGRGALSSRSRRACTRSYGPANSTTPEGLPEEALASVAARL